jgi:membrane-bound ClpP family serine protease
MGAAKHSSEDSRQVLPLNHPARGRFRLFAALSGVVAAVWSAASVGVADGVTIVFYVTAVLAILASLAPGNAGALGHVALGSAAILLGLFTLAVTTTSLNSLHASVLNICGFLTLGLIVGGSGLYEWETDDHGRMTRRIRAAVARDVRDSDVRRDPLLADAQKPRSASH